MSRPLYRKNLSTHVTSIKGDLGKMRRARPTGQWQIPVKTIDPLNPDFPVTKNGWLQPANPKLKHMYRWHMDGSLQFRGHLEMANTISSGKVAYTLPGAIDLKPDFRPDKNFAFRHYVITKTGVYIPARYEVDAATGDVTVSLESSPLPYASIENFHVLTTSIPTATSTSLDTDLPPSLDPTKSTGFTTDASVFDVDVNKGQIKLVVGESGVYIATAVVYWNTPVSGRKLTFVSWPGVALASSDAHSEIEDTATVTQHTEHRRIGGEFLTAFSMAFEQRSGASQPLKAVAIEVTRLVDNIAIGAGTSYTPGSAHP